MSRQTLKNKLITFRADDAYYDLLCKVAKNEGRSISNWLQVHVLKELKEAEKELKAKNK